MPNTINTKLDDTNFPIIHITFGNTIKDDAVFEQIKNFWMKLYTHEKYFYMIFDTSNMNTLPISYIYKLSKLATQLKKLEIQYMKASILIIKVICEVCITLLKLQNYIKVYIVKEHKDVT